MRFSPVSAVLGALATTTALLFVSATPIGPQILRVVVGNDVQVKGIPDPKDMIHIQEGTVYTVPVGKILVLTGVVLGEPSGTTYPAQLEYQILVDSVPVIASNNQGTGGANDVFFWGYAVQANSIVEIDDPVDTTFPGSADYKATILAYLADA